MAALVCSACAAAVLCWSEWSVSERGTLPHLPVFMPQIQGKRLDWRWPFGWSVFDFLEYVEMILQCN
jgi:hypothetical protein